MVPGRLFLERICGCIFQGYFTEISGYFEITLRSRTSREIRKFVVLASTHKFFDSDSARAPYISRNIMSTSVPQKAELEDKVVSVLLRQDPPLFLT